MDVAIGVATNDAVLLLSDRSEVRSIVSYKQEEDKIFQLDKTKLLATTGDNSSRVALGEYVSRNFALQRIVSEDLVEMSNHAAASWIRDAVASSLRTRNAFQANVLYGGVSAGEPALYFIDYFGNSVKQKYSAHGYAGYFALATLDRHYREDMTVDEASELMKRCVAQLKLRFLINLPKFTLKVITKSGVTTEVVM